MELYKVEQSKMYYTSWGVFFLVLFFYLNLHGDSDLEDCTLNSSTKLDAHHVGLYKVDSLKDIMAQSVFFFVFFFKDLNPHSDLDLEGSNPSFQHDAAQWCTNLQNFVAESSENTT